MSGGNRDRPPARRRKAWLLGVAGGSAVAVAGAAVLRFLIPAYLVDLLAWGLGVLVAPIAAAIAAAVLQATPRRFFAAVGFALLAAFAGTNLVDFLLTMLLFVPGLPGPYATKAMWSGDEVDRVAETWLVARHVIAMTLSVLVGAISGARFGHVPGRLPPVER
jgi:hypothetical protein